MGGSRSRAIRLFGFGAIALMLAGSGRASVVTAWNLVPALDPNNGSSMTISDASSNTGTDGVTLSSFSSLVSTAYTNGLGGVFNFQTGTGGTGDPNTQLTSLAGNTTMGYDASDNIEGYDATPNSYAAGSGSPSTAPIVSFYRSDANSSSSAALDWNSNQGAIITSGPSGGGYLGIQGTASYSLTFQPQAGYGVTDFGLTSIARDASGQTSSGSFTVHFSNGSTITSSMANVSSTTSTPGTGVFFGFQAPTGLTITSVDWANSNSTSRFGDLALIVATVPEPASMGLFGMAGGLLLWRRRRR